MAETFPLRIHRPRALANALRAYRLLVDGRELASITSGDSVTLYIPHGSRELVAKIDWVRSRPLDLSTLAATPDVAFDCLTHHNPIQAFRAACGLRNHHIEFVRHDPARAAQDDTKRLTVRLREASLWLVACALGGLMLTQSVDNLALSPELALRITQTVQILAGLVGAGGGLLLLRK